MITRAMRLFGPALWFLTAAFCLTVTAAGQSHRSDRRGATQPLSPVSMVSWVTENGSQGARLDLAIIWRGEAEWFFGQPQRSSIGGSVDRYSSRDSYGDTEVAFTLLENPRRLDALDITTPLTDHNVVLVDGVGSATGPRIVRTLRIAPAFSDDRNIEGVLRTSPEVVAFIGCDIKASSPGRQAMFDRICERLR